MTQNQTTQNQMTIKENIVNIHSKTIESIRKIAGYLISRIEETINDEHKFHRILTQSDRASLTLQRLSSIMGNVIPMEQGLMDRKMSLLTKFEINKELERDDFELIIYFAKELGLIKEGSENDVDEIYGQYLERLETLSEKFKNCRS
jgi:hypothetical protein